MCEVVGKRLPFTADPAGVETVVKNDNIKRIKVTEHVV